MMAEKQNEARAVARYIPMSPFKVRRVIDVVRGMDVDEAIVRLQMMPQRAAKPVIKVVRSAAANAEENLGLSRRDLYIHEIMADEGPRHKRYRFGARGRVKPRTKRTTHITVVLREYEYEYEYDY